MKKFLLKNFFLFLPFAYLGAQPLKEAPTDQFSFILGASGYVLYKVLDFANDHGFRYVKILSYECSGFDHIVKGSLDMQERDSQGRLFELKDGFSTISFLCYKTVPHTDLYIIDLEKYRDFLHLGEE